MKAPFFSKELLSKPGRLAGIPWARWVPPQAASGALLGPVLDSTHGAFGVLAYDRFQFSIPELNFATALWVPPLFGVAAVVIGALALALDDADDPPVPSTDAVGAAVAAFCYLYWLSGLVAADAPTLANPLLWPLALGLLLRFDPTRSTLFAAIATAVAGPAIELLLVYAGLYHYADPDLFGLVDAWIPAVYFAGAPPVAMLGRWWLDRIEHAS